jgi:hypothetical protein
MDEGSLAWRSGENGLPSPDTASRRDLAHAMAALGTLSSVLTTEDRSGVLIDEQYPRIRRIADWISAATVMLMTPTPDPSSAAEVWDDLEPGELSHALLIATLMSNGGSHVVPASIMTPDALAGRDGALHAASVEQLPNGFFRISVCPRPDTDSGGSAIGPRD